MKRLTFALLVAVGLLATMAYAEKPQPQSDEKQLVAVDAKRRYANTRERWRGRPHLRRGTAHPVEQTASERVYEFLPSVNFMLEGQAGGAFVIPPGSVSGF